MRHSTGTRRSLPSARCTTKVNSMRGLSPSSSPIMSMTSSPVMPSFLRSMPSLKVSGNTPMPTRLDRSGPLGSPVARRAHAVFLAAKHDERDVFALVAHRGVVNLHLLTRGIMPGDAALDTRYHLVANADIGEDAAHHDFVVAAA